MISCASVWAIVLRHMYVWRRDLNLLLSIFYWPLLDILIWGFLGSWISQMQTSQLANYTTAALLGVLLWQVVGRGANIMVIALSEEIYNNNMINLFSMPLKIIEWMSGITIVYGMTMFISLCFSMSVMFALYDLPIFYTISTFLFFVLPLFISCLWISFMCLSVIIMLGKRGIELGLVVGWALMPFSGAYYPVEILPAWGQIISAFLPMSYVFSGMRGYVMHQQDPTMYLIKGYCLSILYAACAIILFIYCFNCSKQKGLARLSD